MNLRELIENILELDGTMTKYQIAVDLGVSTSTVLGWANGTKTRCFRKMKLKLEEKYNVKLDDTVIASHKRGSKSC